MRKTLLSFTLLLTILLSGATQDYRCINPERVAFFITEGMSEIASLRIDSIATEGLDTIYYPMKNIRGYDYDCYTPYGASGLGDKIVIRPDGTHLFFNYRSDTLLIRSQARIGERWRVFADEQLNIEARLDVIRLESFFGITDTVKVFIFNANIPNPIGDMELWISKKNGILKTPNFYFFPDFYDEMNFEEFEEYELAGLTNPEIGAQNITWEMVHDYDIGDEIHTEYYEDLSTIGECSAWNSDKKILTINKFLGREALGNKIRYLVGKQVYQIRKCGMKVVLEQYTHDTVDQDYSVIDTIFDKLPGEVIIERSWAYTHIMNGNTKTKTGGSGYLEIGFGLDSCGSRHIGSGCVYDYAYINGLGGPYFWCWPGIIPMWRELVYYKKGDTEWGTPLNLLPYSIENKSAKPFKLYPNPAAELVTIELLNTSGELSYTIYNCLGKIVGKDEKIFDSVINIDISGYPQGAYYIEVINSEGKKYTSLFMKQ